jgi:hemicentin
MECDPSGVPEPTITWLKDGTVIDIEQTKYVRILRSGRVLQIVAANVDDSGLYSCSAQNSAGHEQRRYRLQVHGIHSAVESSVS